MTSNKTEMRLTVTREALLKPLQLVMGVVERRQTMPILANVLLKTIGHKLMVASSDLEVEILSPVEYESKSDNFHDITIPGRKLMDICRSLVDNSLLEIVASKGQVIINAENSRFVLATLPANEFPLVPEQKGIIQISIAQNILKKLTAKVGFAVPQQDSRNYLNGMVLEIKDGNMRAIASDGHRLALITAGFAEKNNAFAQVIIPRKGVAELMRLLDDSEEIVELSLNNNYIRLVGEVFTFTSKLIAGKFPNYNNSIPRGGKNHVIVPRDQLKQAITRVAILSNEIFRSVKLKIQKGLLQLSANNPEQETATENIELDYKGEDLEIVFNVGYLLDILHGIDTEKVSFTFKDNESGAVIEEYKGSNDLLYVLMPIKK
jgi:DNA polymerase III subunit beta